MESINWTGEQIFLSKGSDISYALAARGAQGCKLSKYLQLIDTAMRLFSEQGFDGTTTQQIANAAGINEAIIFRHFKSKEELYWAVVSSRGIAARKKRKVYAFLDGDNHGNPCDDREALAAVATRLLDRSKDDARLTRLLIFSSLKNPELSEASSELTLQSTSNCFHDFFAGASNPAFATLIPMWPREDSWAWWSIIIY